MKITVDARALSAACASAASLSSDINATKFPALTCVLLRATGDTLTITANTVDHVLTLSVPAKVESGGDIAVSARRIATLAAAFPGFAEIKLVADGGAARITGARSRFRLPGIPLPDLPDMLRLTDETGRVELATEEAHALFARTGFAIETQKYRFYLCGVLLQDTEQGLTAVAADGRRLAKLVIPGTSGLSSDLRLIVPTPCVKIVLKLLNDRDVERVVLRRSRTYLRSRAASLRSSRKSSMPLTPTTGASSRSRPAALSLLIALLWRKRSPVCGRWRKPSGPSSGCRGRRASHCCASVSSVRTMRPTT